MIYTCYEMIRDCRADRAEGWNFFVSNYAPVVQKLVGQYGGDLESMLILLRKPESSLFQSMDPSPERWLIAEIRQKMVAALPPVAPAIPLDLETVADALAPLTVVEKQAAWFETMRFTPQQTGEALRMAPATVEKIRARAAELIRGKVDSWRRELLAENGHALGLAAADVKTKDCLPAKMFLDVLDGRSTWRTREDMDLHVSKCWRCVDHFCRMAEVIEVLRGIQPLSEQEAAPLKKKLGIEAAKTSWWRRRA